MPNHCYNRVSVYSDNEQDIQTLFDIFENGTNPKNDLTVFGQIIPEPNWKEIPVGGKLPVMDKREFGMGLSFESTDEEGRPQMTQDARWYDWRIQNWGTKWDCYDLTIDESELPNGFEASFNTAWSPPEDIYNALKEKFEGMSISWFYDEPGMEIAGYL